MEFQHDILCYQKTKEIIHFMKKGMKFNTIEQENEFKDKFKLRAGNSISSKNVIYEYSLNSLLLNLLMIKNKKSNIQDYKNILLHNIITLSNKFSINNNVEVADKILKQVFPNKREQLVLDDGLNYEFSIAFGKIKK